MAYNVSLRTTTFGGEVNFLDSQQTRSVRGGVTLDVAQVTADGNGLKKLLAGVFIGKQGNGKWAKYVAATLATLATGVVGNNNAITWTAKQAYAGAAGNAVKVALLNNGVSKALEVTVVNQEIRVQLATDGSSVITSTAAQVIAAVNTALANIFVTAANTGASTGAGLAVAVAAAALAAGADANVTPALILAEDVNFTTFTQTGGVAHADQVATAYDSARVIAARLPAAPDAFVKANMPGVSFV